MDHIINKNALKEERITKILELRDEDVVWLVERLHKALGSSTWEMKVRESKGQTHPWQYSEACGQPELHNTLPSRPPPKRQANKQLSQTYTNSGFLV